ncbi:transcriptional regulator [Polaribacter reichenbachii]|uniref:Transcriptional regulator n=1 Tax=Polaribacter reichenbachii TaxID=996801 RepID=A0A1B8U5R6_9FLAO|nr:LytTR family DNA-binding domain-containing protein [Polaribacter reichenbachii]APZ47852.1 transcriptional regulator [Polaribacter reichenbachii]AUC18486.1 transcriptional regulator [Polaribacter reichenbachii]OBY67200.1 transcriptional regulator [Polaribacter reichenbachii]
MKKDKLYFLTFLSIAAIFLLVALFASKYFIKVSANQLIEVQVESSKREANEIAKLIDFQLSSGIKKGEIVKNIQQIIENTNTDSWFISVFNWSGKEVANPDKTKVGQLVSSNQTLLASLKEKNNSDNLYDLLVNPITNSSSEIIHISPIKNSDLIIAANVNIKSISIQMNTLKSNFYLIFLVMGILIIVLSFLAVRVLGSAYEKQLELRNTNLTSEVVNLSKLNTDLVSYKEKVAETPIEIIKEETTEKEKERILTYVRNELVPIATKDIAYVYTENTITYVVCFDGKRSTTNLSLDDMYTNLNSTLFFRANRQFIISITAIDKIIKYGNSQLKILLQSKTSEEIIISKNKAAEFKQWLSI